MYESTDGWLCVSNMADRAAGKTTGELSDDEENIELRLVD